MRVVQEPAGSSHQPAAASKAQQLKILLKKNLFVSKRNLAATMFPLALPPLLCFIVFIMGVDDAHNISGFNANTFEVKHPPTTWLKPLPVCDKMRMPSCTSPLGIVGTLTSTAQSVVDQILAANPQVANTVTYYKDTEELNQVLLATPQKVLAAVHFDDAFSLGAPKYVLQYNLTRACLLGAFSCNEPLVDVGMPLQMAVESAIIQHGARTARGDASVTVKSTVGVAEFAHPEFEVYQRDISRLNSPSFIFIAVSFNYFIQMNQLATEKDLKLKLQMRVMGTQDGPMWFSWMIIFLTFSTLSALILTASFHVFNFDFITRSDFSVYFLFIWVTYLAHTSFACFASSISSRAAGARAFVAGTVLPVLFTYQYIDALLFTDICPTVVQNIFALFPPVLFVKGLIDLINHSSTTGYRWADRFDNGFECPLVCAATYPGCKCRYYDDNTDPTYIFPLQQCMVWLFWEFILYFLAALYFEQITTAPGYGNPQSPLFFLSPSYWTGREAVLPASVLRGDVQTDEVSPPSLSIEEDALKELADGVTADVVEEMKRVLRETADGSSSDAIRIVNLKKSFQTKKKNGCGTTTFTAVARVNLGIPDSQLFCLLGHNGAGKTTTFNMLSGILKPTRGDAFIFGKSVRRQLRGVQGLMGLCPQHDVLWAELTADEHLQLFAGLSGIPESEFSRRIDTFLTQVDLIDWRHQPSKKYSGGMRRRLSVANALISDPKVVYLDEPTTGMDPVNRRGVWDVIEKAKKGRVVVLTTHAMEEAETLGDRIGIMSRGRLLCLGTSLHLKAGYGSGYTVDVSCQSRDGVREVLQIVQKHAPAAHSTGRGVVAKVPQDAASKILLPLYQDLGGSSLEGIDTALNMCTLEEVFIDLAEKAQDPEWLLLKYGQEPEKLKWYEKCDPRKRKEYAEAVADYEAKKASGTEGDQLAARVAPAQEANGSRHGPPADPEEEEVLGYSLAFRPASFKAQHKALSKKNEQFQAKQKRQKDLICACTMYPLALLFVAEAIVSLIVGSPTINCNVSKTDTPAFSPFQLTGLKSLNVPITNPNLASINRIISELQYISNAKDFKAQCLDKELKEPQKTYHEYYTSRIPQALCAYRPQDELPESIKLEEFEEALVIQGCNMSIYHEIENKFAFLRNDPSMGEFCQEEGRPNLTVSYEVGGNTVQEEGVNLDCNSAVALFKKTCSNVTAPPTLCPRNLTKREEEEEKENDIGALLGFSGAPTLRSVLELETKYKCAKGADDRINGFATGGFFTGIKSITDSDWHVVDCMATRMCSRSTFCGATADKVATFGSMGSTAIAANGGNFPQCSAGSGYGPDPNPLVQAAALGGWLSSAATNAENFGKEFECLSEAYTYCRMSEAVTQCPGLVQEAMPKKIPFSVDPSMPWAEVEALGSLRYDPSELDLTTCAPNCFGAMLALSPAESSGALSRFNIEKGDNDIARGISYVDVDCIKNPKMTKAGNKRDCALTREDLDRALYEHWSSANRSDQNYIDRESPLWWVAALQEGAYQGAFHFDAFSLPSLTFNYTVLYNGTFWPDQLINELGFGGFFVDYEVGSFMHRINAAIYKATSGYPNAELDGSTMSFPSAASKFSGFNFVRLIGPFMLVLLASILFPVMCWALVSEKSAKLREIMVMSGLQRKQYWLINYMHWFGVYMLQAVVVFLFCYLFPRVGAAAKTEPGQLGFKLFTNHDPIVNILLWVLYGLANTSFSFFFSTLFNDKYLAIIVPFFIIQVVPLTAFILTDNAIQVDGNGRADIILAGLMPMYALMNALQILAAAAGDALGANGVRLTMSNIGVGMYSPVSSAMWILFFDFLLYTCLFVYCDIVLPVGPGVKLEPLFFLKKSFWAPEKMEIDLSSCMKGPERGEAADVTAERARVADNASLETDQVRCLGLRKIYPNAVAPAVVNVQFGIKHRECFGLLGSNGAGKSTTIHILCGLHAPTEGTVLCKAPDGPELDIRKDLTTIQSAMGVCPQDNLLWDDLTGDQHLQFFGRLRGLADGKPLKRHIAYWLKRVNLATRSTKGKPSKAYSGGMKRRLSVACSFVGNPRLVYLDEPSTGLDPESRRQLWYAISTAKRDKSIILTTHALEEADALCDRLGIMTLGQMRVIGPPSELRMRFDQGYTLMIAAALEKQTALEAMVMNLAPSAQLRDAISGVRVYNVPKNTVNVGELFQAVEAQKEQMGIKDWGLSQTSLEEVFLTIVAATSAREASLLQQASVSTAVGAAAMA